MKLFINVLLICLLTAVAAWFFPWWMIAVVPFLYVVIFRVPKSFVAGFSGIVLFWLVWILWKDIPNEHILSTRMARLFSLPHYSLLIIVNILLGGLIGGLAAYSGSMMNRAFRRK